MRDAVVEFVRRWGTVSGRSDKWLCVRIGIVARRLFEWRRRDGTLNKSGTWIPKSHWLSEAERKAIVAYYLAHPGDGYRRCAYMMVDEDVAYASPATVYRVLCEADAINKSNAKVSLKGTGFVQPNRPHEHWHTDISYVKVGERFYYLVCVLDGYSRYIVNWGLKESMEERDVAIVQQGAVEKYPRSKTRYITDNGKQFTGREFRKFIAYHGLTHVRISPGYPQSNGKLERFHLSIKGEALNRKALVSVEQAKDIIKGYVDYYNNNRLHSAIGYVAPRDRLEGKDVDILKQRDEKMRLARMKREENGTILKKDNQQACNLDEAKYSKQFGKAESGNAEEHPNKE